MRMPHKKKRCARRAVFSVGPLVCAEMSLQISVHDCMDTGIFQTSKVMHCNDAFADAFADGPANISNAISRPYVWWKEI